MATVQPSQREEILAVLSHPAKQIRESLRPWFERTDALDYARQRAGDYVQSAVEQLDVLPPGPARDTLHRLAQFVITRQN